MTTFVSVSFVLEDFERGKPKVCKFASPPLYLPTINPQIARKKFADPLYKIHQQLC